MHVGESVTLSNHGSDFSAENHVMDYVVDSPPCVLPLGRTSPVFLSHAIARDRDRRTNQQTDRIEAVG